MASVASQLLEEVTAHAQSDSFEDAREICADGTYFPSNLRILLYTRLHVSTFSNGHHQVFQQIESTDVVYMLGSQYVYIDRIH